MADMRAVKVAGLAALTLSLVLAGCLGSSNAPTVEPTSTSGGTTASSGNNTTAPANQTAGNGTANIKVTVQNGTAAGVTVSQVGSVDPNPGDSPLSFNLDKGVTGIVVEAAWKSQDQMTLYVTPPCSDPTTTGITCPSETNSGSTSPVKVMITDGKLLNQTGTWSVSLYPQLNPTGTPYTAYVSLFYGPTPTDNYTAVPRGK